MKNFNKLISNKSEIKKCALIELFSGCCCYLVNRINESTIELYLSRFFYLFNQIISISLDGQQSNFNNNNYVILKWAKL